MSIYSVPDTDENLLVKEPNFAHENLIDPDISRSFFPTVKYILSDEELTPYVRGLMHRARKQGKLFEDLISEKINRLLYNGSKETRDMVVEIFGMDFVLGVEKNICNAFVEKKNEIFKGAFKR